MRALRLMGKTPPRLQPIISLRMVSANEDRAAKSGALCAGAHRDNRVPFLWLPQRGPQSAGGWQATDAVAGHGYARAYCGGTAWRGAAVAVMGESDASRRGGGVDRRRSASAPPLLCGWALCIHHNGGEP